MKAITLPLVILWTQHATHIATACPCFEGLSTEVDDIERFHIEGNDDTPGWSLLTTFSGTKVYKPICSEASLADLAGCELDFNTLVIELLQESMPFPDAGYANTCPCWGNVAEQSRPLFWYKITSSGEAAARVRYRDLGYNGFSHDEWYLSSATYVILLT